MEVNILRKIIPNRLLKFRYKTYLSEFLLSIDLQLLLLRDQ